MQPAFPRRLLATAVATGVDPATVGRHLPIVCRCVPGDDTPVLLARVDRDNDRASYLLVLTHRRLVVTGLSPVLRRRHLHLNTDPRHLIDVMWTAEPTLDGLALSLTAVDGVREHFWLRTIEPQSAAAALATVFRPARVPGMKPAVTPALAPTLTAAMSLRPMLVAA